MRIPRIYTTASLAPHSSFELEAGPSQHLLRALRMQAGSELVLFDGKGGEYPAVIATVGKKRVTVSTGDHRQIERESPLQIHLGIAVSRGERMDWVMQKATELGVSRITPLFSEHTEVKLKGDRALKKIGHWQQIATSACEQCGRNRVPEVAHLQMLQSWLPATGADLKLVLHHRAETVDTPVSPQSLALLVGPEGGLSEAEIAAAEAQGFKSLKLGDRVLRTETAPLAALAILQAKWGDIRI